MIIHTVTRGETITSIAQQYRVSAAKIISDNELTNPNNLVVGQTIVILGVGPEEKVGTLSVNGYAYPFIERDVLRKTLPYLSYITLFTYGFKPTGELIPIDDTEIVNTARDAGVAPIMLISTLTDEGTFSNELSNALLSNPDVQNILIENIVTTLKEKNYYGLDIDFEYILPANREQYVEFVRKVTERLNAEGYIVIVALAPKTSSDQPGLLYEAHDYAALGAVSNYVLLMTYEWGFTYGPPMVNSYPTIY